MRNSRLTRVRDKRATRQAAVYIVLSIAIMIGMIFWGIPEAAKLSGLLIRKDNGPVVTSDVRPTPPIFSDVPEATNAGQISVSGFAQPGVDVELFVNGASYDKSLSDDAGTFSFDKVKLIDGDNQIYAVATSPRGTASEQSRQYTISVDRKPPELKVDSPTDGQVFNGDSQRIAEFKGSVTEDGTQVYVGDRIAIVSTDNTFDLPYQMIEGDQEVTVKAIDKAGNETDQTIKLTWKP